MLHAGLDLSRKKLDVCLLSEQAEIVEELPQRPMPTACVAWRAASSSTLCRCAA
jgi:hypothetical protein